MVVGNVARTLAELITAWVRMPSDYDTLFARVVQSDWARVHKPVLSRMIEGKPRHELYTGFDVTEPNGQPVRCHQGCGIENRTFSAQGSKIRFYCLNCDSFCLVTKVKADSSTALGASSLVKVTYLPMQAPTRWDFNTPDVTPSVAAQVEPILAPSAPVEPSIVPPAPVEPFPTPPTPVDPFLAVSPPLLRLISLLSGYPTQSDLPMQVDPPVQTNPPMQIDPPVRVYPSIQIDPPTRILPTTLNPPARTFAPMLIPQLVVPSMRPPMPTPGRAPPMLEVTPKMTIRIPAQRNASQVTPQTQAPSIAHLQSEGQQALKRSVHRILDLSTETQKRKKKK